MSNSLSRLKLGNSSKMGSEPCTSYPMPGRLSSRNKLFGRIMGKSNDKESAIPAVGLGEAGRKRCVHLRMPANNLVSETLMCVTHLVCKGGMFSILEKKWNSTSGVAFTMR
jgi:hypothetical protein